MRKLVLTALATASLMTAASLAQPVHAQGLFQLPNFIGDTRIPDSHYNTMHQWGYDPWDTYQLLLQSYAAQARAAGSHAYPPPPYSRYNYAASIMNSGPGGPVPSPAGDDPTFVDGSSGVEVHIGRGGITGLGSAGVGGTAGMATTSVTGQVISPSQVDAMPVPGLVGP